MATVRALLDVGAELPSEDPRRDAEILLCHALNKDRAWLYTWPEGQVEGAQEQRFTQLLAARRRGEPIAYLTGRRDFWTLELEVNQHTLIPRSETETLVEWALQLPLPDDASVLDLGTGSGAIALALATERSGWSVSGIDACDQALAVARRNSRRLSLSRVEFLLSDWYDAVPNNRYHLLVANPPYIDQTDIHLTRGDLPHEPRAALVAPEDGLGDLRSVVTGAPDHLHPGGMLLLEHGYEQAGAVRRLLLENGFADVQSRCDLAGLERVTGGSLAC